ncbi:hypothetical protein HWV62_24364 [Athelia sp. TMB]|nr:hypothetical protein HWV62_24364 [Athelia sp. TMB]
MTVAAFANVMSHNALVAFYPRLTFVQQRNYLLRRPATGRRAALVTSQDPEFLPRPIADLDDEDYELLGVHEGKNRIRSLGDAECWTMAYDGNGNYTDSHSTVADTPKKNGLEGNRWYMRVETGIISHEIEAARLSDFDMNL